MKTREEVEELKRQWKADPNWDIETTDGFEEYHDELLKFREDYEVERYNREQNRLEQKAKELDLWKYPTTVLNIALVKYLEKLENRIDSLSKRVKELEDTDNDGGLWTL